jgi:hypothetical protein
VAIRVHIRIACAWVNGWVRLKMSLGAKGISAMAQPRTHRIDDPMRPCVSLNIQVFPKRFVHTLSKVGINRNVTWNEAEHFPALTCCIIRAISPYPSLFREARNGNRSRPSESASRPPRFPPSISARSCRRLSARHYPRGVPPGFACVCGVSTVLIKNFAAGRVWYWWG